MKYIEAEKLKEFIEHKRDCACDGLDWDDMDECQRFAVEYLDDILADIESLKQEQPERPDFDDVDPNHLVHSHYTKVREIKTGKEFWAEYSSEAAEWYEAGTGKAYSISDVEIVKEQPKFKIGDTIHEKGENTVFPMTIERISDGDYVCNGGKCFVSIKFQDDYELIQQERSDAYEDAMLEVKEYVDKLYDEKVGIGLCEYDSGLFDGIAKICIQLRGFIKLRISLHHTQPESELEKAARYVYESWNGGTMDDVRRDMVELGKVLNARKED